MRALAWLATCALVLAGCASAPPPKSLTPPMGWNSWNSGIELTEQSVHQIVDAMVSSGMRDAGYRYVNLDAGWAAPTRDSDGHLQPDPDRFPHGIAALARYVHDRGMLLGIYHSPFNQGCGQDPRIGGAGHEHADAQTFADWGVDYLKYDWCRLAAGHDDQVAYFTAMRDALHATGRNIVYSINPNSSGNPRAGMEYDWSHVSDVTRNAVDLVPAWGDAALWSSGLAGVDQAFTEAGAAASPSGPSHINDPDMMVIGLGWNEFVVGHPTMALGPQRADLTDDEQQTHFSLWALLAAPLLAGNDIRSMSPRTAAILTNREVIAVDQDPLVVQGHPLAGDPRVLVKPLSGGAVAVGLFNQSGDTVTLHASLSAIGLADGTCHTVRDLWRHNDATTDGDLSASVPRHGVALLRVSPGC
ncbi:glycoside hydrolase family 27 protein [Mycolicibacterium fluoranthenivorans]|uniref:Alpha-galactosidase n=1 Tax=Mycolicibacterium fluoranthenivorans TaxID=258505 RepID=A0A7X5U507_9MYCO|nr:glycoside hydrolase family 27 protein [Mycolicibacterium fluoranthenivorans]MCV7357562.1 glycoside hydrolase family 27 protein [Mycolicibacterium fluoranthenivorans]NIH98551.1 alpha-galactosidase [Mycolicibacterium fluoranthenivorans]